MILEEAINLLDEQLKKESYETIEELWVLVIQGEAPIKINDDGFKEEILQIIFDEIEFDEDLTSLIYEKIFDEELIVEYEVEYNEEEYDE